MLNPKPIQFDPELVDRAYKNYLANCRRLGIEPMSWERVQALAAEWLQALVTGHTAPPNDELALRRREDTELGSQLASR
jgi:hypothetical protein